jgi:hypothetical protein
VALWISARELVPAVAEPGDVDGCPAFPGSSRQDSVNVACRLVVVVVAAAASPTPAVAHVASAVTGSPFAA